MKRIDEHRAEIDIIDRHIMELLAKRQAESMAIARIKASQGLDAYQPVRHQAVLARRQAEAASLGLSQALVLAVWKEFMDESVRLQQQVILEKNT